MQDRDGELLADARARLSAARGQAYGEAVPVGGGRNNRLYRLPADDGDAVLVKVYVRDDRRRLEREFGTLGFLRPRIGELVPEAILADEARYYGVYGAERGEPREAGALSVGEVEAMARCAAALHAIAPGSDGCPDFPPAIAAAFRVDEIVRLVERRIDYFVAATPNSRFPVVRELGSTDEVARVRALVRRSLERLRPADRTAELPRERWRISNADFAPQNILVRPDGTVCAVDWEYAGWDDPARMLVGFIAHGRSVDLPPALAARFLRTYAAERGLDDRELERIEALRALHEVEWVTIHMNGVTEDRLQRYLHARPGAEEHAYMANQAAGVAQRLARAEALLG